MRNSRNIGPALGLSIRDLTSHWLPIGNAISQTTHEKPIGLLGLSLRARPGVNGLTLGSILSKRPPLA
jgi:hypothetical protein